MNNDIKYRAKDCSLVYTPVQRGSTCWFAALMMTLFFSQYMRAVAFKHAKKIDAQGTWKSPIANAMIMIMKNYEVNSLDSKVVGKLEPRAFLKALRAYDSTYFDSTNSNTTDAGANYGPYQHKLLAFLEIPHLSLTVPRGHISARYSAYNFDLPLDQHKWEDAVRTSDPVGKFVDTEDPEVIIIHREAGESYLQSAWRSIRPPIHNVVGIRLDRHPNTITYNSNKYVLDSCIIPSHVNTDTCTMGHAVAGVTCNDKRYVYNGWAARSADKAMIAASRITRHLPCALMEADWAKDKALCINTDACTMDEVNAKKKPKHEFCFEAFKRSSVVYVREDMAKNAGYIPKIILKIPPKPMMEPQKIAKTPPKPKQSVVEVKKTTVPTANKQKLEKLELLKKRIATTRK